jgi:N-acetylglucosamine-6-sulfatase
VWERSSTPGILESTLLVFTSDNGFQFGEHGLIDKRTMYEESVRVPLIVHCPDLIEGGSRRAELITNLDFAPTFIELAGVQVPPTIQGESFLGLLDGSRSHWRDAFLYEYF